MKLSLNKKQLITLITVVPLFLAAGVGGGYFIVKSTVETKLAEENAISNAIKEQVEEDSRTMTFEERLEMDLSPESLKKIGQELAKWREELVQKEKGLALLDQDLIHREQILKAEQDALVQKRMDLINLQKKLEEKVVTIQKDQMESFQKLASFYSTMKIETVIEILRKASEDDVVRFLSLMTEKKRLKIVSAWSQQYPNELTRVNSIVEKVFRVVKDYEPIALAENGKGSASSPSGPESATQKP